MTTVLDEPADLFTLAQSQERLVSVLCQQIRVDVRQGTGVPLVLCNGIGAAFEVFDPLLECLNPEHDRGAIRCAGASAVHRILGCLMAFHTWQSW